MERIADAQVDQLMRFYEITDQFELRLLENVGLPASNKGLSDLAEAIAKSLATKMELYGIPTEQQRQGRERLAIEREKVKLQQEQVQASKPDAEQTNWHVHMTDEEEDDAGR